MVEIVTERGRKLSATPNHPMLTRQGWRPANFPKPGDDLICYIGDQNARSASNEDVATQPATIALIFNAVATVGIGERRVTVKPDFHGDGVDGEVDIFRPHRELCIGTFAAFDEPLAKNVLSPSDLARFCFCRQCGRLFGVSDRHCFCDGSKGSSEARQFSADREVANAILVSKGEGAFSGKIPLGDYFYGQIGNGVGRKSTPSEKGASRGRKLSGHACAAENLEEPSRASPHLLRNLHAAQPGEIQFDRVLTVRVRSFRGHVFNLSTAHGYFAANGVYTGNTMWASNAAHADGIKEIADEDPELADMQQQWIEHCDDEGEALDSRVSLDSLAMHLQVTEPGGMFTMPDESEVPDAKGHTKVSESLAGQSWAHPPNRPNDRATVLPWRPGWGSPGWRYVGGARVPA